ncbi:MAG: RnfABCDGE type electron transport complex subunit B [Gammaproteobacteria bacterium]|nr:RnfABCDGE type electron transport complex subunit B [Gammaproteobacteria bacterium]MDE2345863.1 RnfABCDGE type electron transport complex subunit B [Gammaproteobacteria bacterium]
MKTLTDQIDALLPQTQCRRCGFEDCRAYADAIAKGETGIDRCPPGGLETLRALAALTGQQAERVDPSLGGYTPGNVAFVIEDDCIGCTKCIQACPVDAIVGAAKLMHTVVEALCTGCELCVPPCPVDCIRMQPARGVTEGILVPEAPTPRADFFRARYRSRRERLARIAQQRESRLHLPATTKQDLVEQRRAEIAAAVQRVRARRARRTDKHES